MPSACARWSGRCHSSTPADASSPSDITDRAGRPPADGKLRPPQWRCSRIVPILPENDPFRSFSRPGQTISSLTQPALRSQKRHSAHASIIRASLIKLNFYKIIRSWPRSGSPHRCKISCRASSRRRTVSCQESTSGPAGVMGSPI